MAIRQAVVNNDKVIVAGTFFSCTPTEGPVQLMDMMEVVRTLCNSLRLLRGHAAQQGYTTAAGNSENGPTDFMFATKDIQADRNITSGNNFNDECNDLCGDMDNKLNRPTPHHPIATNINWKTNDPMESPIPEQPRENLTLWLDLPEAVADHILEPSRAMGGNYVNDNGEHDRFSPLEATELDVNSQAHVGLRFECHLPSSPHGITLHNRAITHVDESGSLGRMVSSGNTEAHWPTTNDHIVAVNGKDDVDWQLAHGIDNGYTIMFRKGGHITFPNGDQDYLGPVLPDAVHGEQFLPMPAAQCSRWFVNASNISIKHKSLAAETDAHPHSGTHYIAFNLHRSFCPDTPANPDDQGPRHDNAVESSANGSACVYITGWESHITMGYLPLFNTQPPDPSPDYIHDMAEEKRLFQEQILVPCQDVLDKWKRALATPKGFDSFITQRYIKHVNIGGDKDPKVWTPITRLNTERLRQLVNEHLITCIGHEHWIDPKTKHELRNYFEMIHTREQERLQQFIDLGVRHGQEMTGNDLIGISITTDNHIVHSPAIQMLSLEMSAAIVFKGKLQRDRFHKVFHKFLGSQQFHATPGGHPRAIRLQVFTRVIDAIAGAEPATRIHGSPGLSHWRQSQPNLWASSLAALNQWKDEDLSRLINANIDWPTWEDPVRHMHKFLAGFARTCVPACSSRGDSLFASSYFLDTIMFDPEDQYGITDTANLETVWKHTPHVTRAAIAYLQPSWTTPFCLRAYELHRLVQTLDLSLHDYEPDMHDSALENLNLFTLEDHVWTVSQKIMLGNTPIRPLHAILTHVCNKTKHDHHSQTNRTNMVIHWIAHWFHRFPGIAYVLGECAETHHHVTRKGPIGSDADHGSWAPIQLHSYPMDIPTASDRFANACAYSLDEHMPSCPAEQRDKIGKEVRELLGTPTTPLPELFKKRQDGHNTNPAGLDENDLRADWGKFRIKNAFQLILVGMEGQLDARRKYTNFSLNTLASEFTGQFSEHGHQT